MATEKKLLDFHKVTTEEFSRKSKLSQWGFLLIQLVLSVLGAYSFYNVSGYSAYHMVVHQEPGVIAMVVAQIILAIVFLVVGSTAYARGFKNTLYKWLGIIVPAALIVVINYVMLEYYNMPIGSGIVALLSIGAFYMMFSTSSSTLSPMGLVLIVFGLVIGIIAMNHYLFDSSLSTNVLVTLVQAAVALMFFFGLNFAKILFAITGTRNMNAGGLPGGETIPSGNEEYNDGEG